MPSFFYIFFPHPRARSAFWYSPLDMVKHVVVVRIRATSLAFGGESGHFEFQFFFLALNPPRFFVSFSPQVILLSKAFFFARSVDANNFPQLLIFFCSVVWVTIWIVKCFFFFLSTWFDRIFFMRCDLSSPCVSFRTTACSMPKSSTPRMPYQIRSRSEVSLGRPTADKLDVFM